MTQPLHPDVYHGADALGWAMDHDELPPPADHAPTRDATQTPGGLFVVWEIENEDGAIWSDTVMRAVP